MARGKKRNLAGFGEVASNDESSNESNNNSNNESGTDDIVERINNKKRVVDTHPYRGYYLEKEVSDTIDRIAKGKKGAKSDLVNSILKNYFIKEGYMKKN